MFETLESQLSKTNLSWLSKKYIQLQQVPHINSTLQKLFMFCFFYFKCVALTITPCSVLLKKTRMQCGCIDLILNISLFNFFSKLNTVNFQAFSPCMSFLQLIQNSPVCSFFFHLNMYHFMFDFTKLCQQSIYLLLPTGIFQFYPISHPKIVRNFGP